MLIRNERQEDVIIEIKDGEPIIIAPNKVITVPEQHYIQLKLKLEW